MTDQNAVMIINKPRTLILGATGGIGGAVAARLLAAGHDVARHAPRRHRTGGQDAAI